MATVYRDGKRLSNEEAEKFVASQNSPMMGGGSAQANVATGGSNKKGPQDIKQGEGFEERLKAAQAKYNNDGRYGYYGDDGRYVGFWSDATNGGGADTTGNYFQGGGAISAMLNAAKVRPSGAARARDDQGNYIVDRRDIGFRNINDWFDRGGPQASGGKFQGLGSYSALANMIFGEQGQRTTYADQAAQAIKDLQNPVKWGVRPTPAGGLLTNPPTKYKPTGGTIPATGDVVGALGSELPQTGLLNQYQGQYENIPAASQPIRLPEIVVTPTANQGTNISVDQMRTALQAVGDPAWNHKHELVVKEAYNRMMGR